MISSADHTTVLSRRDHVVISCCLLLLTALAWAYLIHLDREMSAMMEHDRMMAEMGMSMDMPWRTADVLLAFAMWAVMMVGMMTPSAAPVVLLVAGMNRKRGAQRVPGVVFAFGAGYLLIWVAFSAAAALSQWALHQAALLSPAMTTSSTRLGAAILIAAGIYQLTPFDGTAGALRMGMSHGSYCLGCCWALMGVLFVVGVMNLMWVAAIAIFVLMEKVGPAGTMVARVAGVAMIVTGVYVLVGF